MKTVLRWTLVLLGAGGCSLLVNPDKYPKPTGEDEVRAHWIAYFETLQQAIATTTGTTDDAAREYGKLGDEGSYVDRAIALWRSGRVKFDAEQAQRCLEELRAAQTYREVDDARFNPERSCRKSWIGRGNVGDDCYSLYDCHHSAYCDLTDMQCPGLCRHRVPAGTNCEGRPTFCQYGLSCQSNPQPAGADICLPAMNDVDQPCGKGVAACGVDRWCDGSTSTCQTYVALGGACSNHDACGPSRYCANPGAIPDGGVCQARVDAGSACTPGANACAMGSYCTLGGVCRPNNSPGASCAQVDGGEAPGCQDGWCNGVGVCVAFRKFGESCGPSDRCVISAACNSSGRCGLHCP